MPATPTETDSRIERCILLLCDTWRPIQDGIAGVNRSVALSLTSFKGLKVYSTVYGEPDELDRSDREDAANQNVTLVNFDDIFSDFKNKVPFVTHIVGHAPLTGEIALRMRDELFPESKVILFYHVIPQDVDWLYDRLQYEIPSASKMVEMAEQADVVYSVTQKLHFYYTAILRNRAQKDIDHRLFLPQCPEQTFAIPRRPANKADPHILVVGFGTERNEWEGLDIATCAVNKVATAHAHGTETRPLPALHIGGIPKEHIADTKEAMSRYARFPDLDLYVYSYKSPGELYDDLGKCSLCLVPSRAEPYGYVGLHAISAGIPTLIAEDSALATLVRRLTSEPEYFLVPVTSTSASVRQDGSVWRDRIMSILQEPETAHERAMQLRTALKRDEMTKESHDSFVSYCLGGIHLKHEATQLDFLFCRDAERELPIMRNFNKLLTSIMKQCWRLKHHPLTKEGDLFQLIAGVDMPVKKLAKYVTDKIEEHDRRIVEVDKKSGGFIVYCPTPGSLSDLWAMCDRINDALVSILLSGDTNPILQAFRVSEANVRTVISGPEFLKYKKELVVLNGRT